jgi:hypothetical protein
MGLGLIAVMIAAGSAQAVELTITIENLAPQNGVYLTPAWVGFHNGSFDIYDVGDPASAALERLAEDGNTGPLATAFGDSGFGDFETTIPGPNGVYAPGDIQQFMVDIDGMSASSRYFSFASMVIPSNDAFISNGNPMAFRIFDDDGTFLGANFFILGSMVNDAGTEVNTEAPDDTAFFGQMQPNTGPDENGVVHTHMGFKRPGMGGILDSPMFANADFIGTGYPIAQIRITPEPTSAALLVIGGAMLLRRRRTA